MPRYYIMMNSKLELQKTTSSNVVDKLRLQGFKVIVDCFCWNEAPTLRNDNTKLLKKKTRQYI